MRRLEWPLVLLGWLLGAVLALGCGHVIKQTSTATATQEARTEWHKAKASETTSATTVDQRLNVRRSVRSRVTRPTPAGPEVTETTDETVTTAATDTRAVVTAAASGSATGAATSNSSSTASSSKTTESRSWWKWGAGGVLALVAVAAAVLVWYRRRARRILEALT